MKIEKKDKNTINTFVIGITLLVCALFAPYKPLVPILFIVAGLGMVAYGWSISGLNIKTMFSKVKTLGGVPADSSSGVTPHDAISKTPLGTPLSGVDAKKQEIINRMMQDQKLSLILKALEQPVVEPVKEKKEDKKK